jgi:hypothetical protein
MPKRAKLLIAFSVMLYGAFLAEKIALATGFSLVAAVSIASYSSKVLRSRTRPWIASRRCPN